MVAATTTMAQPKNVTMRAPFGVPRDDRAFRHPRLRRPSDASGCWRYTRSDPPRAVPDKGLPGPVGRAYASHAARSVVLQGGGTRSGIRHVDVGGVDGA